MGPVPDWEQQIRASHLQTVTFGWGSHVLCEVEVVLCKTLTKSYFKCKMERNINISPFARARVHAHTHTHTHTGTSEKEIQVSSTGVEGLSWRVAGT